MFTVTGGAQDFQCPPSWRRDLKGVWLELQRVLTPGSSLEALTRYVTTSWYLYLYVLYLLYVLQFRDLNDFIPKENTLLGFGVEPFKINLNSSHRNSLVLPQSFDSHSNRVM